MLKFQGTIKKLPRRAVALPDEVGFRSLSSSSASSISEAIFVRSGGGCLGVAGFFVRDSSGDFFLVAQGRVLGIFEYSYNH